MKLFRLFLRDLISFSIYLVLCLLPSGKKNITLLYHSVDYVDPAKDRWRMNITPERFEEHLKFISGFKGNLEITFDDGYKNNFTRACPLLLKYNLRAAFFLTTDFIDGKLDPAEIWGIGQNRPPLSWQEVKEMLASGMKIGSHGKSHKSLAALPPQEMEKDLSESKKRIEEVLNTGVDSFSYPIGSYGTFNPGTQNALSRAGYARSYVNVMGFNPIRPGNNSVLKRVRINTEDNIFRFKMKIKGAYNWVDLFNR